MAGSQNMQIKMRCLFSEYQINKDWEKNSTGKGVT